MICPECKIPFVTHKCNKGRENLLCPLGCRQKKKKEASNRRSKKYYKTAKGKQKKKRLNRARHDKTIVSNKKDQPLFKKPDPLFIYLRFILDSILKIRLKSSEINSVFKKMRSRSLVFMQKACDIPDHYE